MASYNIEWGNSTKKDLHNLQAQDATRVLSAVGKLANDPRPHGSKKLAGYESSYRIRLGNIRVLYEIRDLIRVVFIERVRHRKDVYR